jgi:hypothetical protein
MKVFFSTYLLQIREKKYDFHNYIVVKSIHVGFSSQGQII